ncbi:MAG: universal stress protein [Myxococcales bacterium]|nr:universal stress protein [Myxococcales bacterium]
MKITRILAPTDFSELSRHAVDEAVDLAKQLDAEVVLLHVCPLLVYALEPDVVPDDPAFEQELKKRLGERLQARAAELAGARVRTLLVDGNPSLKVAEVASEEDCDLVVMATHGRTGMARFTLGSVAERTVRSSRVPVMTVPAAH